MGKTAFDRTRRLWVAAGFFVGCATAASSGRPLWESGDEFVRIVPQDRLEDGQPAPKNEHPVRLATSRVAAALEQIRFRRNEAPETVLDEQAVERLAPPLAEALAEAKPTEDAVFAIHTPKAHWLLGGEMSSVAARVFVLDDHLHVIVGDLFRSVGSKALGDSMGTETKVDRRIAPHRPGRRAGLRSHDRELVSTATTTFQVTDRGERPDWLVIKLR